MRGLELKTERYLVSRVIDLELDGKLGLAPASMYSSRSTYLARLDNGDRLRRLVASALRDVLHGVDNVHALDDVTEDDLDISLVPS